MIELRIGSDAYGELWRMLDEAGTYMVRIDQRADGVALKRNEGTWSPTLATVPNSTRQPRQPSSTIEQEERPGS